ncbi:MAG: hypothetical protein CW716_08825, partial [Candidatus Bathyarchaeum sp.]
HKKRSRKRGISPVVSSVIMTGAMVAILSVALVFANNLLWSRVAEGEFNSSKQLMQTAALQIDDVAWTAGRTETVTYASQYGSIVLEPSLITYTVSVGTSTGTTDFVNTTAALMFNMPTSQYSISDDYWERIYPDPDESLTLTGTSAPVGRVFAIERTPMPDGKNIRVVVAPSIRVLNSSIVTSTSTFYIRVYLPVLSAGESPRLSQSVTFTGKSVEAHTLKDVLSVSVSVSFPRGVSADFDSAFFNFPEVTQDIPVPVGEFDNVVFELYLSEVSVGFGVS